MKTITPQHVAVAGIIVAALVALITNWSRMVKEWREYFERKRQGPIRALLFKLGSAYTADCMLQCPKLSQTQIEKALLEMETSGEIVRSQDNAGRVKWRLKVHPGMAGNTPRHRG